MLPEIDLRHYSRYIRQDIRTPPMVALFVKFGSPLQNHLKNSKY